MCCELFHEPTAQHRIEISKHGVVSNELPDLRSEAAQNAGELDGDVTATDDGNAVRTALSETAARDRGLGEIAPGLMARTPRSRWTAAVALSKLDVLASGGSQVMVEMFEKVQAEMRAMMQGVQGVQGVQGGLEALQDTVDEGFEDNRDTQGDIVEGLDEIVEGLGQRR